MKDSVVFCESLGFTKNDLKKHPELLKKHVTTLDNQYTALKESGFVDVKPEILARYMNILQTFIFWSLYLFKYSLHVFWTRDYKIEIKLYF